MKKEDGTHKNNIIKGDSSSCLGKMLKTEQAWISPVSSHFQRDIVMTSKTVMKEMEAGGKKGGRTEQRHYWIITNQ